MRQDFAVVNFLKSAQRGSPLLCWSCVVMVVGMAICFALPLFDARLIAGVSVWEKPAKFFLALIVHGITVAWAISLLQRPARGVKVATFILVAAGWFEMAYMIFRAARGEASHFNVSDTLGAILYPLMGLAAISLTATSAFIGWRAWQQRASGVMIEAAGLGLGLGAALGTVAGAYLSSQTSHWIGGDFSDATGLGFFHWSTTGGDLRVAHFIGLHAAQALPLCALSRNKFAVYGLAFGIVALASATFCAALIGTPLLRG